MAEELLPELSYPENRYFDAVRAATNVLVHELTQFSSNDDTTLLEISQLIGSVDLHATISHANALEYWNSKIRPNDDVRGFVSRATTRSRFLAGLDHPQWSFVCVQLACSIHPGHRGYYIDAELDLALGGEGLAGQLLTKEDYTAAVDDVLLKRTDLKQTFLTLVNNPWLTWLYVASLCTLSELGFKAKRSRGGSVQ